MLQGPCRVYEGYEGCEKDLQEDQEDEEEGSEETIGFKKRQKGQIKKKQKKSKQNIKTWPEFFEQNMLRYAI